MFFTGAVKIPNFCEHIPCGYVEGGGSPPAQPVAWKKLIKWGVFSKDLLRLGRRQNIVLMIVIIFSITVSYRGIFFRNLRFQIQNLKISKNVNVGKLNEWLTVPYQYASPNLVSIVLKTIFFFYK
jgi:hypothetical protein